MIPLWIKRSVSVRVCGVAMLGLGTLAITGCGATVLTPGGTDDLRLDINEIQLDVGRLQESQNESFRRMEYELQQMRQTLEAQQEMLRQQAAAVDRQMARVREDLMRLAGPDSELGMTGTGVAPATSDGTGLDLGSDAASAQVMMEAEAAYARGDYETAITLFSRYVDEWPAGPEAAKAVYSLGRSYYQQADYARAESAFSRVIEEYPASDIVPQSLHSLALCQNQLSRFDAARDTLSRLQREYPAYEQARVQQLMNRLPQ